LARILITGGAGFIGANLAHALLGEGHQITVFDNLSRPGSQRNYDWLCATRGRSRLQFVLGDVADFQALCRATEGAERIYHLAGQVAVTLSLLDPRADFRANAVGTFNALEAARAVGSDPVFIYASTNKVYGALATVGLRDAGTRYEYTDLPHGIPECQPLDFGSPYACSKGAGDQYVRDYYRSFGLRTVVIRQSCIYGPRQFGAEDQGWVAWLMIAARTGQPITIYGNGTQVRDLLFITDLLDAYERAVQHIDRVAGQAFNVGGGPDNTLSVWSEFGPLLEELVGRPIPVTYGDWRPGDQRVYVSDIRKAKQELGWSPRVSVREGLGRLYEWLVTNLV
jgi:CDP-paratose 2-epimerase